MSGVGNVFTKVGEGIFGNESGEERDLRRRKEESDRLAKDNAAKLEEQKKAIDAQKKSEEQALNAKKKRMAQASSGGSSLLNFNPESGSSILG
ncbi:MAG: hypothetical protein IPP65_13245 [Chlorobi bacterium]|nr:hypothetical protein [Chlorobiota bacterium]